MAPPLFTKIVSKKEEISYTKTFDLSISLNSTTFIRLYIFPVSQIPSTDLSSLINVCVYQLRSHRLDVPEEMTNLIFSLNKDLVQPLIDSLGLSESGVQVLAEVYIEKLLPDLKFYNDGKKRLP